MCRTVQSQKCQTKRWCDNILLSIQDHFHKKKVDLKYVRVRGYHGSRVAFLNNFSYLWQKIVYILYFMFCSLWNSLFSAVVVYFFLFVFLRSSAVRIFSIKLRLPSNITVSLCHHKDTNEYKWFKIRYLFASIKYA